MEFGIKTRVHRSPVVYSDEEKKLATKFTKELDKELGDFLKAVVLFGSAAKHTKEKGSDIDVLLLVDDASTMITPELTETYRVMVEKLAAKISLKFHISTLKITHFWEYAKHGDPVLINILRDGVILQDKGCFRPLQALLDMGKIRPTREAIWTYYARVPITIKNAKWHIMQACVDLYWAGIDAAHAALMAYGQIPPSPIHVPDMLEEHLVKKKLLDKRFPVMMRELYDLSKHIQHRQLHEVSGEQFDAYLKEAKDLVLALRTLVREQEKKKQ